MSKRPEKLNQEQFGEKFDQVSLDAKRLLLYFLTVSMQVGPSQRIPVLPVMEHMGFGMDYMADLLQELWDAELLLDWDNQMVLLPRLEGEVVEKTQTPTGLEDGRHNRGWR